jgi:hypothetical protein
MVAEEEKNTFQPGNDGYYMWYPHQRVKIQDDKLDDTPVKIIIPFKVPVPSKRKESSNGDWESIIDSEPEE